MPLAVELLPLEGAEQGSTLFVACNICPRLQALWQTSDPLVSWRSFFGVSDGFSRHMESLVEAARTRGNRAAWMRTPLWTPMCLWDTGLNAKFARRAQAYDAIAVVGCESAVETVQQLVMKKRVHQLVHVVGIANFTVQREFPFTMRIIGSTSVPFVPGTGQP